MSIYKPVRRFTCAQAFGLFVGFAWATTAWAQVMVELVPDHPGPYAAGETITVDVWLHSGLTQEARLGLIQFDFSQTDSSLALAPTFAFDYSSIPDASGYKERHLELPVPWTRNARECVCPDAFLPLPPGGVLRIGSVGLQLPTASGVYRLDALNASHGPPTVGQIGAIIFVHLAVPGFTGEITGGILDFIVLPPIPAMSGGALLALAALLGSAGSWIAARGSICAMRPAP